MESPRRRGKPRHAPAPGHPSMSAPDFFERRLSKFMQKPPTVRAAGTVIVSFTAFVVVVSAALIRLFDPSEFNNSFGDAIWWACQTVTTVGYGDVVPENVTGRIIGVIVMLQGIALITVVSAVITSTFIERARRERARMGLAMPVPEEIVAAIQSIDERLARIEERLDER